MTDNPRLSSIDYDSRYYRTSNFDANRPLLLKLNYTDHVGTIEIDNFVQFSPTTTIREIKTELTRLFPLRSINPEEVILTGIDLAGQRYKVPSLYEYIALKDLKIASGSVFYFKRLGVSSRPKLSQLTVFSLGSSKRENFEWDESSTTIDALVDFVIKTFNLYSVERERIQLSTYLDKGLNKPNNLGKKLTELGLGHYSTVYLHITKPTSTFTYDEDIYVYVKSNFDEGVILSASSTDTIDYLEARIKNKYKRFSGVVFLDNKHNTIHASDRNRTLRQLGIQPGQTINAHVEESLPMTRTDELQLSLSSANNPNTVLVRCQFSDNQLKIIRASLTDTVAELTAKITALRENQTMAQFLLLSDNTTIDDNQPDKRLADFGIQPGSTISAYVTDIVPTNCSIKSNKTDKTYTTTNTFDLNAQPKGLDNLGNTCFMNSALQCLVHVAPLTEFFMKNLTQAHSTDGHANNYNPFDTYGEVTGAYAELLWNLHKPDRKSYSYYDYSLRPSRMKETIGRLEPRFATYDQQDAQEFMAFLLDTIHQEIKQKNNHVQNTIITELFFSQIQSSITCSRCQHVSTTKNPISILPLPLNPHERTYQVNFVRSNREDVYDIVSMSVGDRIEHLVQKFFERRHDSRKFSYVTVMTTNPEAAVDFDTPLIKLSEPVVTLIEQDHYNGRIASFRYENKPITLKLDECLQAFVSVEILDDPWFCEQDKCKRDTKASKELRLLTFPHVLIIQLKRFSHENGLRQKLDIFVDYQVNGFDLGKLLKSSEEAIYDLIAVCNHMGSIYGGHYTAYARKDPKSEKWYRFNDSYVSTVYYNEEIVSRDAYLLFYLKRHK